MTDDDPRPRARVDRQPRARLRLRGRRARPLERARGRARASGEPRGPERTSRARVRAARVAEGRDVPCVRPHPARTRPRLECVGDRARPRRGRGSPRAASSSRELLAAGLAARGPLRQSRAALAGGVCLTWDGRSRASRTTLPPRRSRSCPSAREDGGRARIALPARGPARRRRRSAPGARRSSARASRRVTRVALRGRARRPAPRAVSRCDAPLLAAMRERPAARARSARRSPAPARR